MITRDLDEILETLVLNYMTTLVANQQQFKKLTVVVFAVLPPVAYESLEEIFVGLLPNPSYIHTQITVTNKLNDKLEEHCRKNNFIYMNVNKYYQNPMGDMRLKTLEGPGGHHIHPKYNQPVKDTLFSLLLK